jgi:large subunit ribosomal protein L17
MRHRKKGKIFGRVRKQRKTLFVQLCSSLVLHQRIITTEAKAKAMRPLMERIISKARGRQGDVLSGKRYAYRFLSADAAKTLFKDRMGRLKDRQSGWTRITKLGSLRKDGARKAMIEFV